MSFLKSLANDVLNQLENGAKNHQRNAEDYLKRKDISDEARARAEVAAEKGRGAAEKAKEWKNNLKD